MILAKSIDLPSVAVPMTYTGLELTNWFQPNQFIPTQMFGFDGPGRGVNGCTGEGKANFFRFQKPGVAKDDSK